MELFPVSIEALSGLVVRGPMFFQAKTVQIRKRIISPYHLIIMQMKKVFLSLLNVLIILTISIMGIGVECQHFYEYFIVEYFVLWLATVSLLIQDPWIDIVITDIMICHSSLDFQAVLFTLSYSLEKNIYTNLNGNSTTFNWIFYE